jgi:hypothetical protein
MSLLGHSFLLSLTVGVGILLYRIQLVDIGHSMYHLLPGYVEALGTSIYQCLLLLYLGTFIIIPLSLTFTFYKLNKPGLLGG